MLRMTMSRLTRSRVMGSWRSYGMTSRPTFLRPTFLKSSAPKRNFAGPAPSQVGKVSEMGTIERILTFNGLMSKYPWTFGVGIATAKTGAADILVQKQIEKREKLDWQRVGLFTLFGFAYLGIVQYLIYVNLFSRLFKNAEAFGKMPFREKIRNKEGYVSLGSCLCS